MKYTDEDYLKIFHDLVKTFTPNKDILTLLEHNELLCSCSMENYNYVFYSHMFDQNKKKLFIDNKYDETLFKINYDPIKHVLIHFPYDVLFDLNKVAIINNEIYRCYVNIGMLIVEGTPRSAAGHYMTSLNQPYLVLLRKEELKKWAQSQKKKTGQQSI